jgi:hypothetical protein
MNLFYPGSIQTTKDAKTRENKIIKKRTRGQEYLKRPVRVYF